MVPAPRGPGKSLRHRDDDGECLDVTALRNLGLSYGAAKRLLGPHDCLPWQGLLDRYLIPFTRKTRRPAF
jgi:hypothetical protein